MDTTATLENILQSVRTFLQKVNELYPVQAAYLFGSYARGEATADSDIDLAVVSEAFTGQRFEDSVTLGKLTWRVDTRIEPVALRPEALEANTPLMIAIKREGVKAGLFSSKLERHTEIGFSRKNPISRHATRFFLQKRVSSPCFGGDRARTEQPWG